MELYEIKQYSHKIIEIKIENKNTKSSFSHVTVKIHLEKEQNETIRFSLDKNENFLEHQSNGNDYFLRIPNITPSITTIYAHFFPSELYHYTEDQNIFSIYDFSDFFKEAPKDQWYGNDYPLQINSYGYEMVLGDENKPLIRSLLNNSITKYKDPNYKNYINTNINKTPSDMTEQGRFPLSSRYRGTRYDNAPEFNKETFPHWKSGVSDLMSDGDSKQITDDKTYTYNTAKTYTNYEDGKNYGLSDECGERDKKIPYWEAKIHKTGLSPLISKEVDEDYIDGLNDYPINAYLNYQYLPTSTEYHQHYFGFEDINTKMKNGEDAPDFSFPEATEYSQKIRDGIYKQLTTNRSFMVLDGEELPYINNQFGLNSTYRLINHGNPFDDKYIMSIDHKNIININLDEDALKTNCDWEKNQCEDYWTYISKGKSHISFDVKLKANTPYVLKYFIYIPIDAYVEDDSCYVNVTSMVNGKEEIIGKLDDEFINQDKKLRHQWIYHEIPFYTYEVDNRIVIKGPQHSAENITIDTEEEKNHNCKNDLIHFYSIQIAEMVEYSPTIKYTETGLYLVEEDRYTKKPLRDITKNDCIDTDESQAQEWIGPSTKLPTPLTDIYILLDNDFQILYNPLTSEISWTKGDFVFNFDHFDEFFDESLAWSTDESEIKLNYEEVWNKSIESEGEFRDRISRDTDRDEDPDDLFMAELSLFNKQQKLFTTGINNEFTITLQDAYGNPITTGIVECAIFRTKDEKADCSAAEKCLGERTPDEFGKIEYTKLNFKDFTPNKVDKNGEIIPYWLRIKYTNKCYEKTIIQWKRLQFQTEYRNMTAFGNTCTEEMCLNEKECCEILAKSVYDTSVDKYVLSNQKLHTIASVDEFPFRIDVKIRSQPTVNNPDGNLIDEGYCELSIDDKVIQSTFVDSNGIADFYLDKNDLDPGQQIVKIEYYTKYNTPINFLYFPIKCDVDLGYDERPSIPIIINTISAQSISKIDNETYSIPDLNDVLLINIDDENNENFSITIIKNEEKEVKNITNALDKDLIITGKYIGQKIDTYQIITGNLKNEDGTDINNDYSTTVKSFRIIWGE